MKTVINEELLNISKWLKADQFSLNVKNSLHDIHEKKHIDSNVTLYIDGESVC